MRRREAIIVFKQLSKCVPGLVVSSVSVTPVNKARKEVQLRVNGSFDSKILEEVRLLVRGRGMSIKEEKDSLLIYENAKRSLELIA